MNHTAHIEPLIDLLVEAVMRELASDDCVRQTSSVSREMDPPRNVTTSDGVLHRHALEDRP